MKKKSAKAVKWTKPAHYRAIALPKKIGGRYGVVAPRLRTVHHFQIHRRYGPAYYGYGFYFADADAYPWIAFTAITLKILDNMSEEQARYHEQAQIEATTAPIGEAIIWEEDDASGAVVAIREGQDSAGHQCREFRQTVTIGDEEEEAYGTACLQADGAWQIVS